MSLAEFVEAYLAIDNDGPNVSDSEIAVAFADHTIEPGATKAQFEALVAATIPQINYYR